MERKEWRFLAIGSLSILCVVLLSCIPFAKEIKSRARQKVHTEQRIVETLVESGPEVSELPFSEENIKTAKETAWTTIEQEEKNYIKFPKQANRNITDIYLQEDYMSSKIVLNMVGDAGFSYDMSSVTRSFDGKVYKGSVKKEELLKNIEMKKVKGKKQTKLRMIFAWKQIWEPALYETEDAYYITLADPGKVYDHILVLDAGHGGMDEGTMSVDKRYEEKAYTLLIVKKLYRMFEGRNIKIYCTRTADVNLSKNARVELANRVHADLFVSVHCNAAEAGEHQIGGLETLYSNVPLKYGHVSSKKLAQIMLDALHEMTSLEKRGIINREGLYILRNSKVPATIVEVGYMTNTSDMNFMKSEKGQNLIVKGIYKGILKALESR